MLGTMTLTGGLLAAGLLTFKRSRGRDPNDSPHDHAQSPRGRLGNWLGKTRKTEKTVDPTTTAQAASKPAPDDQDTTRFGLYTSTISLGLSTVGVVSFPPLTYACIPTLIYMGIPSAQEAYESLQQDGRVTLALAETAALGICLAGGYLWTGSLGFCIYHLGRTLVSHYTERADLPSASHAPAAVAHRYENGVRVEVPVSALHRGDQIHLETGELSPVTGVIVEGNAWLQSTALPQPGTEVWKKVGDQVHVKDLITIGRICVQVQIV